MAKRRQNNKTKFIIAIGLVVSFLFTVGIARHLFLRAGVDGVENLIELLARSSGLDEEDLIRRTKNKAKDFAVAITREYEVGKGFPLDEFKHRLDDKLRAKKLEPSKCEYINGFRGLRDMEGRIRLCVTGFNDASIHPSSLVFRFTRRSGLAGRTSGRAGRKFWR